MIKPRHLKVYTREAIKFSVQQRRMPDLRELLGTFPAWQRCLKSKSNAMADSVPWLTFKAIQFLERTLKPTMRVYEYGAGGSTLFFSRHAGEVISVEHDRMWAERVQAVLKETGCAHVKLSWVPSEPGTASGQPADPDAYISDDASFRGHSFRNYAASIDAYPDSYFDLVLIDGRARPSCCKHALHKVKPGGWIMLDNAERPYYRFVHTQLATDGWRKEDLGGPGLYNEYFWQTCAWQKNARLDGAMQNGCAATA